MHHAGQTPCALCWAFRIIVVDSLSDQNPLIKQIRRAVSRGTLTEDGYAIAEGTHLLEEAIAAKCEIRAVIVAESAQARLAMLLAEAARGASAKPGLSPSPVPAEAAYSRERTTRSARTQASRAALPEARVVTDKTFRDLSSTNTPQGVITLVRPPEWPAARMLGPSALVIVLDGLQDPGNAGAILRAAEAFGASGVVFLKGTVNPYNPKCLRGSAGSVFRVPIATELNLAGLAVYAAMPRAAKAVSEADFRVPCAIVIGSESHGVHPEMAAGATGVRIETAGVESLNAAVAAGIFLYEARRQRTP